MTRVAIEVPFNTMLADLDEALRALLRSALARHGFNGVQISFDAPSREWAAGLSTPTLNLFMYDLREADSGSSAEWTEHRSNGQARLERPPLRVDCAYSITAWTRAVQDEHRMLSQALAVLLAHERLPADVLGDALASQADGIATQIGRAKREGGAEFRQQPEPLQHLARTAVEQRPNVAAVGTMTTASPNVATITTCCSVSPELMICVAMPSYIQRYDSDQLPSMFATISYLFEMMLAGLVRSCDE
jgi:Pvc16 N-terminal domain